MAQFINLSVQECRSILDRYNEEQAREVQKIKEKYVLKNAHFENIYPSGDFFFYSIILLIFSDTLICVKESSNAWNHSKFVYKCNELISSKIDDQSINLVCLNEKPQQQQKTHICQNCNSKSRGKFIHTVFIARITDDFVFSLHP